VNVRALDTVIGLLSRNCVDELLAGATVRFANVVLDEHVIAPMLLITHDAPFIERVPVKIVGLVPVKVITAVLAVMVNPEPVLFDQVLLNEIALEPMVIVRAEVDALFVYVPQAQV
jgi:hypothetical protein